MASLLKSLRGGRECLCKERATAKIHVASIFFPDPLSLPLFISSIIHCSVPFEMHQTVAVK